MKTLLVTILSLLALDALAASDGSRVTFGVTTRWQSEKPEATLAIGTALLNFATQGAEYFDPDCLWRKRGVGGRCENHFAGKTKELLNLASEFKKETLGYFDVSYGGKRAKRDFGGLWEGYVLDQMKASVPGKWILDVSGDIYVQENFAEAQPIYLTDSVFDAVPYARVLMSRGFLSTSVSQRLGSKVRVPAGKGSNPKAGSKPGEILKIVVFSTPEFSGARAHAWATAAIAGGEDLLHHLETLKSFEGKWAYFYFRPDGTAVCSKSLKCELSGPEKTVQTAF